MENVVDLFSSLNGVSFYKIRRNLEESSEDFDIARTFQFLILITSFAFLYCGLSCYIYRRPHDGPNGSSFVSRIRGINFIGWFFRQPLKARLQTTVNRSDNEDTALLNDGDNDIVNVEVERDDNNNTTIKMNDTNDNNSNIQQKYLFNGRPNLTLIVCALGLLIAYLSWGWFQERIMSVPYSNDYGSQKFVYSTFCVLINRVFGIIVSTIVMYCFPKNTKSGNDCPPYLISLSALSNMTSSWFQYESLRFITFPVQTIFKSSKVFITMLVGKFLGKTFPLKKYLNGIFIGIGVYIFLMSQKNDTSETKDEKYFFFGLLLIICYAMCDAFTSNWQKKTFDEYKISPFEMMQVTNIFTSLISFMLSFSDLNNILIFYQMYPKIIIHSLLMGLASGIGQILIFYTIKTYGPVTFSAVMTTRMIISVIISILYYGHSISLFGIIGMAITFASLYYQVFSRR